VHQTSYQNVSIYITHIKSIRQTLFLHSEKQNNRQTIIDQKFHRGQKFRLTSSGLVLQYAVCKTNKLPEQELKVPDRVLPKKKNVARATFPMRRRHGSVLNMIRARIAIQPHSALQNRIRVVLDFEKTQWDQIWISKLH